MLNLKIVDSNKTYKGKKLYVISLLNPVAVIDEVFLPDYLEKTASKLTPELDTGVNKLKVYLSKLADNIQPIPDIYLLMLLRYSIDSYNKNLSILRDTYTNTDIITAKYGKYSLTLFTDKKSIKQLYSSHKDKVRFI